MPSVKIGPLDFARLLSKKGGAVHSQKLIIGVALDVDKAGRATVMSDGGGDGCSYIAEGRVLRFTAAMDGFWLEVAEKVSGNRYIHQEWYFRYRREGTVHE